MGYMERNIKLILEYEGTAYQGWQYQENATSVQEKLEEAILKLTGERVRVAAAGRTDAGVHARGQVVNFKIQKDLPAHKIEMGLNAHLPRDIAVKSAEVVSPLFNARFQAKKKGLPILYFHPANRPGAQFLLAGIPPARYCDSQSPGGDAAGGARFRGVFPGRSAKQP